VDDNVWSFVDVPASGPGLWLAEHAADGARIGYDARLYVPGTIAKITEALATRAIELVPLHDNPVDRIWTDRRRAPRRLLSSCQSNIRARAWRRSSTISRFGSPRRAPTPAY
jgi:hypothetical protein